MQCSITLPKNGATNQMANKPKRPCNYPMCPNLTIDRYCESHTQANERHRGNANQRGYNYKWRKVRLSYLRDNPLCIYCRNKGLYTPATVIDHIKPHKGNQTLFWDRNNWQPLCKKCHDTKTATHDM